MKSDDSARLLDVRGLPPPEPLEQVLDGLADLPPEGALRVLIHREPHLLYEILGKRGFAWQTRQTDRGYDILITPKD